MCVQIPSLSACPSHPFCMYNLKLGYNPQKSVTVPTFSLCEALTASSGIFSLAQLFFYNHLSLLLILHPEISLSIFFLFSLPNSLIFIRSSYNHLVGTSRMFVGRASQAQDLHWITLGRALALWVLNRDIPKIIRNNQ